jgi:hypothetical protein
MNTIFRHSSYLAAGTLIALCAAIADAGSAAVKSPIAATPVAPVVSKVRIGIVEPQAQLGQGNTGADVAEPVRQSLVSFLSGPAVELVPLAARIPQQIEAEAAQASCTYVLYTTVTQKAGGKGFSGLLRMMAPVASMLPYAGGMGGSGDGAMVASMAAQAATQAAAQSAQQQAMSQMTHAQAGSIKARDELTLQYQLVRLGDAQPLLNATLKAKAKADGEDLLSPLIEKAAKAVVNAVQNSTAK